MIEHLVCWIGNTDIRASSGKLEAGEVGPIGQAVTQRDFDQLTLIADHPKSETQQYVDWLSDLTDTKIAIKHYKLPSPTDFAGIHDAAVQVLSEILTKDAEANLIFHLSPGTPAMAAVWILLSKTRFPAQLIETSKVAGLKTVSIPFDISAEYIFEQRDKALISSAQGKPSPAAGFENIFYRSAAMRKVVSMAKKVASRRIPVLIEGESGTGKELFSRAIHNASNRSAGPFVAVNCGAIPPDLVESQLFGHTRGAFTGADSEHAGFFETANGGTLFLDEVGELPLLAQVKLLRAIEEEEITPLGSSQSKKTDIRLISATNRSLVNEVENGNFREDLYYRLAVYSLTLPPLRSREGDITLLIDKLLEQVNKESGKELGFIPKKIRPNARNFIMQQKWPGNVRQLLNTLRSAAVWAEGDSISKEDIVSSLPKAPNAEDSSGSLMNLEVAKGIVLDELITRLHKKYIIEALEHTKNNKKQAAALLGLNSHQVLSKRMLKHGIR